MKPFKVYQYKMQWILPVNNRKEISDLRKLLQILGPRSFTKIHLRFRDLDIYEKNSWTDFCMWESSVGLNKFMQWLRKELKKNPDICYVEVLR